MDAGTKESKFVHGIIVDSSIICQPMCSVTVKKAIFIVRIIRKETETTTTTQIMLLYKSVVKPQLELHYTSHCISRSIF